MINDPPTVSLAVRLPANHKQSLRKCRDITSNLSANADKSQAWDKNRLLVNGHARDPADAEFVLVKPDGSVMNTSNLSEKRRRKA